MTSQLTALPLGAGEAFLLQTKHDGKNWTVLVDSGNRSSGTPHPLVTAIRTVSPRLRRIDIAICTHQDLDHSRGFLTFADAWYNSDGEIGEFWLPGRWSAAVRDILLEPAQLLDRLIRGAFEATELISKEPHGTGGAVTVDERLRAAAKDIELPSYFTEFTVDDDEQQSGRTYPDENDQMCEARVAQSLGISVGELHGIEVSIEESDLSPTRIIREGKRISDISSVLFRWFFYDHAICSAVQYRSTIETAETIASIAESAIRWRIPIRWFDFGQFEETQTPTGGNPGFLTPVAAVELMKPPPSVPDKVLFFSLRLSQQNLESLAVYRHEALEEPGVMFLGDSRLAFGIDNPSGNFLNGQPSPARPIVVTAPHHGSRINDIAYDNVDQWLSNSCAYPIYVRNGGHHKQTVSGFLNQPNRCCAQCRQCGQRKLSRRIRIGSRASYWNWPVQTVPKCRK